LENARPASCLYNNPREAAEHCRVNAGDLISAPLKRATPESRTPDPKRISFGISACSVTAFNGSRYRQRPISDVVREFQSIREKYVLVVDHNLIGTRREHIARAKDLFRAMAQAKLRKDWVAQATINFADDEELLVLAAEAGCSGVFIYSCTTRHRKDQLRGTLLECSLGRQKPTRVAGR
jgi:hypothetical protein